MFITIIVDVVVPYPFPYKFKPPTASSADFAIPIELSK